MGNTRLSDRSRDWGEYISRSGLDEDALMEEMRQEAAPTPSESEAAHWKEVLPGVCRFGGD